MLKLHNTHASSQKIPEHIGTFAISVSWLGFLAEIQAAKVTSAPKTTITDAVRA